MASLMGRPWPISIDDLGFAGRPIYELPGERHRPSRVGRLHPGARRAFGKRFPAETILARGHRYRFAARVHHLSRYQLRAEFAVALIVRKLAVAGGGVAFFDDEPQIGRDHAA